MTSRSRVRGALVAAVLVLCCAVSNTEAGRDRSALTPEDVRETASRLYFHGVNQELADELLGSAAVPHLLELLDEDTFPRRDNVVAFLAYLGAAPAVPRLDAFLERSAPPTSPEDQRALLLVPEALGRIAGRGNSQALERLFELGDPAFPLPPAARVAPAALRHLFVEQAIRALGFTGTERARQHLERLSRNPTSQPYGGELAQVARHGLTLMGEPGAATANPAADILFDTVSTVDPIFAIQESGNVAHDVGIDYANHVSVTWPVDIDEADSILRRISLVAGRSDGGHDVACCLRHRRSNDGGQFGTPTDGLAIVDNEAELEEAFALPGGRVKIVQILNWCGSPGTNFIGCSPLNGNGIVVVRLGTTQAEAVLWLHEYGHNVGLGHSSDPLNVMHRSAAPEAIRLGVGQCARYHDPLSGAEALLTEIGECHDDDDDDVAAGPDNCPDDPNAAQLDHDVDGTGDVCDNCSDTPNSQADRDVDGLGDECDNCPNLSNSHQNDTDLDGYGDPCDSCPTIHNATQADVDGDGVGDSCDNCPNTGNRNQHDDDDDGFGDPCDNCRSIWNDQLDFDGDLRGDACDLDDDNDGVEDEADCMPYDSAVYGPPVSVVELEFTDVSASFRWTSASGVGVGPIGYDVLRATDPGRFDAAEVLACGVNQNAFQDVDPPARLFFYLIRAKNPCGTTLGADSSGAARTAPTCP